MLVITIDWVQRSAAAPGGQITRMHVRCVTCKTYAPGGTYAHGPDDMFTRERVFGAAKDAGWVMGECARFECCACIQEDRERIARDMARQEWPE